MPDEVKELKAKIRVQMKAIRSSIKVGGQLQPKLIEQLARRDSPAWLHLGGRRPIEVAGFHPLGSEPNLLGFLDELRDKHGVGISLPRVQLYNEPLIFHRHNKDDKLVYNEEFKVHEPVPKSEVIIPDTIIVPVLAFDSNGFRLGYGRGYYDRTLGELRRKGREVTAIGIAYSKQMVDSILPHEIHDQPLDFIVTEKEVLKF